MLSERVLRHVDRLLEQADTAADAQDWAAVSDLAARVLALHPGHEDALALRALAEAGAGPAHVHASVDMAVPYTAAHLADEVRRVRDEVIGERRIVTVLFADAEGFTRSAERVDEELVYAFMQRCLAAMTAAVHGRDGTVTQFRGDGIMALFGAPLAHEDAAVKAVLAALDMRERLSAGRAVGSAESTMDCRFRIGLHTGPVVVGSISDDLQMDFTAIGDTVNLAARMEQAAEPGSVWMTDSTRRSVEGFVVCRSVGEVSVKGRAAPVAAFEVLARSGAATRFEAALARGLSPFVGREHDVTMLISLADRARSRSTAVVVVGDAGVGKSRLLLELRNRLGPEVAWLRAQCTNSGRDSPLLPMTELCRTWLDVDAETSLDAINERLAPQSTSWTDGQGHLMPVVRFLLGLDAPELSGIDTATFQALVVDVLQLVLVVERNGLSVLAVEDVHWIDDASAMVLSLLLERLPPSVLVILTTRPGVDGRFGARTELSRLVIEPLGEADTARLAAGCIGVEALTPAGANMIVERAGGNPLFIEELTNSLAETGLIDRTTGDVAADASSGAAPTPARVHDVILARIDRLPDEPRAALQLASVIGRDFTVRLLDRVAGHQALEGSLDVLRVVELIRLVTTVPEVAFMFKHALVHEIAYGTLLHERRRHLHAQVARAIIELYPDRLGEHDAELARHYEAAEDWQNAIPYLGALAMRSVRAGAVDSALAAIARMEAIAQRVADPTIELEALETRAAVHMHVFHLSDALATWQEHGQRAALLDRPVAVARGLIQQAFVLLESHDQSGADATSAEAVHRAHELREPEILAAALIIRSDFLGVAGRRRESEAALAEATELARTNDMSVSTRTMHDLACAFFASWRADFDETVAVADALEQIRPPSGPLDPTVLASWTGLLARIGRGDIESALERGHRLLRRLETIGNLPLQGRVLNSLGWAHYEVLDLDEAERWNERCLAVIHQVEMPDPEVEANARLNLADVSLERGDLDRARVQLDWVEAVVSDPGPAGWYSLWRYKLHWRGGCARLTLIEDDLDRAEHHARALVAESVETLSRKHEAIGYRLTAETALHRGDPSAATTAINVAVQIADQVGNPTQRWRSYAQASAVARENGDPIRAETYRQQALAVIEAIATALLPERRERFRAAPAIALLRETVGAGRSHETSPSLLATLPDAQPPTLAVRSVDVVRPARCGWPPRPWRKCG